MTKKELEQQLEEAREEIKRYQNNEMRILKEMHMRNEENADLRNRLYARKPWIVRVRDKVFGLKPDLR